VNLNSFLEEVVVGDYITSIHHTKRRKTVPAFIAASVCIAPRIALPLGDGISLPNPLTTYKKTSMITPSEYSRLDREWCITRTVSIIT